MGALQARGVRLLIAGNDADVPNGIAGSLALLGRQGITRLLVEGGATVATALLRVGIVDRLYRFEAPLLLGSDALPAVGPLDIGALSAVPRWQAVREVVLGEDRLRVLDAKL
jgi:diaminohydroxyphosphoribosylaminopyrimidine deaminase/5-amino-6-(5-phosphoribosylamino)uracil reductase